MHRGAAEGPHHRGNGSSGPKMPKTAGRRKHRAIPIGPDGAGAGAPDREERRADAEARRRDFAAERHDADTAG